MGAGVPSDRATGPAVPGLPGTADVVAGLTTAAVVIPKAMAYATVAGLPVQVGLYTAFVPMVVYAFLGASRVLSVSTTTTIAILVGAELSSLPGGGSPAVLLPALAMLTLLVGGALALGAALRLGFLANFISEPVLIGFKAGIGFVIIVDQLPKLLGVHITKGGFGENLLAIARALPEAVPLAIAVGLGTMAVLVAIERFAPRLPAPLLAVGAGIAAMAFAGLGAHGVEAVGTIPRGLPAVVMPDLSLVLELWPAALGIALMSFTETIAAGRAFALAGEPPPPANRELLATGVATAVGGVFGAMPAGGGTSQTAVNRLAGARTRAAGLVTAGGTLLTMLFLAPLIGLMPQATLAAVVIVYSVGLVKPAEFRAILAIRRTEFLWALAAFTGVLLLGTLKGILVAIVVSLVALAQQVAKPAVYVLGRKPGTNVYRPLSAENPADETWPGLLLLRFSGRLFFANAERVADRIREHLAAYPADVVVLDLAGVFDLEYSALKMLAEAEARARAQGRALWLVGLTPEVLAVVRRSPLGEALGNERMFFNLEDAVAAWHRRGDVGAAS